MPLLPTMREKLLMQYSENTINPAVKRGLRLFENITPISTPKAAKSKLTKSSELEIRINSPKPKPM